MCKFLIFAFVIVMIVTGIQGGGIPPEFQEAAAKLHAVCLGETGVGEDKIQAASTGNFIDDQNLKCYLKCVWEKMGTMDEAGNVDVEGMIDLLPPDFASKAGPVIRKCGTKVGADACDNAFLTNKCYYENAPEAYFVI